MFIHRVKWFRKAVLAAVLFISLILLVPFGLLLAGYNSALKPVSLLGDLPKSFDQKEVTGEPVIEISNRWFSLNARLSGKIEVMATGGRQLMSDLVYYAQTASGVTIGLKNGKVEKVNDSVLTINGIYSDIGDVSIVLLVHQVIPSLEISVSTKYLRTEEVEREAILAKFSLPVSEVYTKNRKIENKDLEPEYWLDKEGVCFGQGETSALVYHEPSVSSLQLDTRNSLLCINLDYYRDHPFIQFPYQKDGDGKWLDFSASHYPQSYERTNHFTIHFGQLPGSIPRLMHVPYGYRAGYVFTEHADGGNIKTQRAVYFGSETIVDADKAVGGFVKYNIPVTKSVFFVDSLRKDGEAIFEPDSNRLLMHFLDQIYSTGSYEICLHSPENLNSNRALLNSSMRFMHERYNSVSWIDHGFYSGKYNRESFVADGLDSLSSFYAADYWRKYGIKYFWSPAVELIRDSQQISVNRQIRKLKLLSAFENIWRHYFSARELKDLGFFKSLLELRIKLLNQLESNSQMVHLGQSCPTPLYWQHPTRTNEFYSWPTDFVKEYSTLSDRSVKLEFKQLDKLVENQGFFFNHGYYVQTRPDQHLVISDGGELKINKQFDLILSHLNELRNSRSLYLTTVGEIMNYWILLEHVRFSYFDSHKIIVFNDNEVPIKGLSMSVSSRHVMVDGKIPNFRKQGNDLIFWFDIPAKSKAILTLED